jgi:hypothetical protein
MTVAAINAKSAHMMLVAEFNGLRSDHMRLRGVIRCRKCVDGGEHAQRDEHRAEDRRSGEGIRQWMKNLGHPRGPYEPSIDVAEVHGVADKVGPNSTSTIALP